MNVEASCKRMRVREQVNLVVIAVLIQATCIVCLPLTITNPLQNYRKNPAKRVQNNQFYGNTKNVNKKDYTIPFRNAFDISAGTCQTQPFMLSKTHLERLLPTQSPDKLSETTFLNNLRNEARWKRKNEKLKKDLRASTTSDKTKYTTFEQNPPLYSNNLRKFPEVEYPLNAEDTWSSRYWNILPYCKDDSHLKVNHHSKSPKTKLNRKNVNTFLNSLRKKGNKELHLKPKEDQEKNTLLCTTQTISTKENEQLQLHEVTSKDMIKKVCPSTKQLKTFKHKKNKKNSSRLKQRRNKVKIHKTNTLSLIPEQHLIDTLQSNVSVLQTCPIVTSLENISVSFIDNNCSALIKTVNPNYRSDLDNLTSSKTYDVDKCNNNIICDSALINLKDSCNLNDALLTELKLSDYNDDTAIVSNDTKHMSNSTNYITKQMVQTDFQNADSVIDDFLSKIILPITTTSVTGPEIFNELASINLTETFPIEHKNQNPSILSEDNNLSKEITGIKLTPSVKRVLKLPSDEFLTSISTDTSISTTSMAHEPIETSTLLDEISDTTTKYKIEPDTVSTVTSIPQKSKDAPTTTEVSNYNYSLEKDDAKSEGYFPSQLDSPLGALSDDNITDIKIYTNQVENVNTLPTTSLENIEYPSFYTTDVENISDTSTFYTYSFEDTTDSPIDIVNVEYEEIVDKSTKPDTLKNLEVEFTDEDMLIPIDLQFIKLSNSLEKLNSSTDKIWPRVGLILPEVKYNETSFYNLLHPQAQSLESVLNDANDYDSVQSLIDKHMDVDDGHILMTELILPIFIAPNETHKKNSSAIFDSNKLIERIESNSCSGTYLLPPTITDISPHKGFVEHILKKIGLLPHDYLSSNIATNDNKDNIMRNMDITEPHIANYANPNLMLTIDSESYCPLPKANQCSMNDLTETQNTLSSNETSSLTDILTGKASFMTLSFENTTEPSNSYSVISNDYIPENYNKTNIEVNDSDNLLVKREEKSKPSLDAKDNSSIASDNKERNTNVAKKYSIFENESFPDTVLYETDNLIASTEEPMPGNFDYFILCADNTLKHISDDDALNDSGILLNSLEN